jgi:hypothetical protein
MLEYVQIRRGERTDRLIGVDAAIERKNGELIVNNFLIRLPSLYYPFPSPTLSSHLNSFITFFLMLALTEKQLGQALFYSIKREDFDHAEYLLSLDAPVATSHFVSQDRIAYTPSNPHLT